MNHSIYSDDMVVHQKRNHVENNDTYMNKQNKNHQQPKEKNKDGQSVHCEYCNKYMRKDSYVLHSRTKSHIRNKCRVKMPDIFSDDM
jgi:hypothetical protein